MQQHSSSTCIWSIHLSVDTIFQSLWFLSGFPWQRVAPNKEATEPRVPLGWVEVITSNVLRSPPWLGWPLWNICVTNDHGYFPLVTDTSRSFPHSWLITGFATRLTRRVPLVEQEQLTLPQHLSLPPVLSGVRVTRSLLLCVCFVDLFVLFLLDIVLSVLLRYTDSDYPFGIFKLFQLTIIIISTVHTTILLAIDRTREMS